ncbi:MAG: phosphoribosylanthranilate isomerase [Coriobacteriia bacterium]
MATLVKICGITNPEDAAAAVLAGAAAVGVVFADSPRQVDLARAREVLSVVPTTVTRVGVFVDAPLEFVDEAVERCGLGAVQFHGSESPEMCAASPAPVIKAFSVGGAFDPGALEEYQGTIDAGLLDAYVSGVAGGTGRTFAWDAVDDLPDWMPLVVAGGLTPTNVGAAIEYFRPAGVDVSSGVEEWPGHKDRNRIRAFIEAVREADRRLEGKGARRARRQVFRQGAEGVAS